MLPFFLPKTIMELERSKLYTICHNNIPGALFVFDEMDGEAIKGLFVYTYNSMGDVLSEEDITKISNTVTFTPSKKYTIRRGNKRELEVFESKYKSAPHDIASQMLLSGYYKVSRWEELLNYNIPINTISNVIMEKYGET